MFPSRPFRDTAQPSSQVLDLVRSIGAGTRYALCILKPSPGLQIDSADLRSGIQALAPGLPVPAARDYMVIAGVAGRTPVLAESSEKPFHRRVMIGGVPVEVRMDAWLSVDTIRRMGFGHVIAARHHALIVERGLSLVTFDQNGRTLQTAYRGGIFAPEPRFVVNRRVMVE
jgi:hypothetical protein